MSAMADVGRSSRRAGWEELRSAFLACHRSRVNVLGHVLATPLGIWSVLALAGRVGTAVPIALVFAQVGYASAALPRGVGIVQSVAMGLLLAASLVFEVRTSLVVVAGVAAYLLQDLAHRTAGEPAYEQSYAGRPGAAWRWLEHVALLLPLVIVAAQRSRGSLLRALVPRRSVLATRLDDEGEHKALAAIRNWVGERTPAAGRTTHWWIHELDASARSACATITESQAILGMFRARHGERARIRAVEEMNEVYVTGPDRETSSDRVFYVPHLDGPIAVFPGASLYRCMVAVSPNRRIRTHFPLERGDEGEATIVLDEAEAVAFDYHRTPHYISSDTVDPDGIRLGIGSNPADAVSEPKAAVPRINLKLHYVVSQPGVARWADGLAELSARYNAAARALFLDTLTPADPVSRVAARLVVWQTGIWQWTACHVGHRNLLYLTLLLAACWAVASPWPLVAGGSFVHHVLYVAVLGSREDVSFGTFRRDAMFYKTLSLAILGSLYVACFDFDAVSLALVASGFGTAALAADALGLDRAWFGAELGVCRPERIDRFPYGSIPHPMILGSIVGLVGLATLESFRDAWPWLVPIHVAFYLVHLLQETRCAGSAPPRERRGGRIVLES